eukprot:CAMPEP_0170493420 /NCGR_PEP_ID=MMETSP0208-20121228/13863_1 /TAXON_ID=197538 /ORGANISM="Strombidium inclinatum, Strain S3" /LENGTH=58 /DNA_ID=CAMNT_0010769347 /DNA_START=699 /DNA_END=875 /DNA_ORIENTATION=+
MAREREKVWANKKMSPMTHGTVGADERATFNFSSEVFGDLVHLWINVKAPLKKPKEYY